MKTKDGVEIKRGDKVFNNCGEPRIVSCIISENSIWHDSPDGGFTQHVLGDTMYHSEKLALESHLQYVTYKLWQSEQEAKRYHEQEDAIRLRIIELEKQEELARNFASDDVE